MNTSIFGRTGLRKGASEAKFDVEALKVKKSPAPPKSTENHEKPKKNRKSASKNRKSQIVRIAFSRSFAAIRAKFEGRMNDRSFPPRIRIWPFNFLLPVGEAERMKKRSEMGAGVGQNHQFAADTIEISAKNIWRTFGVVLTFFFGPDFFSAKFSANFSVKFSAKFSSNFSAKFSAWSRRPFFFWNSN